VKWIAEYSSDSASAGRRTSRRIADLALRAERVHVLRTFPSESRLSHQRRSVERLIGEIRPLILWGLGGLLFRAF
jgi:hypothetical protein